MGGLPAGYQIAAPTGTATLPPPTPAAAPQTGLPAGYSVAPASPAPSGPLPPGYTLSGPSTASPGPSPSPTIDPVILAAVKAAHAAHPSVPESLLLAVGETETGLGHSSVYDPVTGLSKTKGNAGHGIWQLDPASGASPQDLERAAHDPFFAADRAAAMLEKNLQVHQGNLTNAVASYNAGSPTPQGLSYAQQVLANVEKWNPFRPHGPIDTGVRALATMAHKGFEDTMAGADAVLGFPQRLVEGTLAGHGDPREGWNTATHPFDAALQARELKAAMDVFHIPEPKGNAWTDKTVRFLEEFAFQTGTDPTILVPLLGEVRAAVRGKAVATSVLDASRAAGFDFPHLAALDKAGDSVMRSSMGDAIRQMDKFRKEGFGIRPELDKAGWGPEGKKLRLSIEAAHASVSDRQRALDKAMLAKYADELHGATSYQDLPEAIKARQLMEPWMYGTPQMRVQAEAVAKSIGINDLPGLAKQEGLVDPRELERVAANPTGDLAYNVRDDYLTLLKPKTKWADTEIIRFAGGKHTEASDAFEKQRIKENDPVPTDLHDLIGMRLSMGRSLVRQRAIDRESETLLRDHPELKTDASTKPEDVVKDSSYSPKEFAPDSPLRGLGRAYKFAISLNPLPHFFKNVGTLAYLWGGPEAFGRGVAKAFTGLDDAQRERLVTMGADPTYIHDIESTLENAPLAALRAAGRASEFVGNRLEMGYRQAILDILDRKLGPSVMPDGSVNRALELAKAAVIRDVLGDYRNASLFTSVLEALGGPFVIFRTSIVPRAVGRAVLRRPGNVESLVRVQQDANAQYMQGTGASWHEGGPVEDFTRMGLPSFWTSPSTSGVLGLAGRAMDPNSTKTLGGFADTLAQFLPFGSEIEAAGGLAPLVGGYGLTKGVSPITALIQSLFGSYSSHINPKAESEWERKERKAP